MVTPLPEPQPHCSICDEPNPPHLLTRRGRCPGCCLDLYIPNGYEALELYQFDPLWGHENALWRPPTGINWLDAPSRSRVAAEAMRISGKKLRF